MTLPVTGPLRQTYRDTIVTMLDDILASQPAAFDAARDAVARALRDDRLIHVAGSGHSHMVAEEVFYRAGGLAAAQAVLVPDLMLHLGAERSTTLERETGHAARALAAHPVTPGDVMFVVSNSGRNAYPVELAMLAREAGAVTIAVTSLAHAREVTSRHPSGKRLFELTDIVIDTCGSYGDAALYVGQGAARMGPTSTVAGVFVLNAVLAEAVCVLSGEGRKVDIYTSANAEVASATVLSDTATIAARWRARIRGL